MPIKVKLRQKPITGGRFSLYLDYYPPIRTNENRTTRRDFLNLYIFKNAKTSIDKLHNNQTLQIAKQIRQKRDNEINKPEIYTDFEKEQLRIKNMGQQSFVSYFKMLADKRKKSNHDNWISAYKHLSSFTNGKLIFSDVNEKFCNDFKEYLLTVKSNKSNKAKLVQNSAVSYFNKFKAALKQAYKEGLLTVNISTNIAMIKPTETQRNLLSLDELNLLAKTPCPNPILKNAALFSALTGLRFSDIIKLIWSEVLYMENEGYFLKFQQQKTKGMEMMPINEQAFQLLGQRGTLPTRVFEGLNDRDRYYYFPMWVLKAGIERHITFHCLRHTYATLQLSNGTDIYTVSKMLGHRELKTTQIYAKVLDKSKRAATEKLKLDMA